jgi:integrase
MGYHKQPKPKPKPKQPETKTKIIENKLSYDYNDLFLEFDYGLAPNTTRPQYHHRLSEFFGFTGLNGDEIQQATTFLEQVRSKEASSSEKEMKLWLRKIIISFLKHLEETGVKTGKFGRNTVKNYYKPIHRFCTKHEIELPWKKVTEGLGKVRSVANDRAPTLEEIAILLKNPDRRIKPIVLIMLSSGIRIGAFQYLDWKHIIPLDIDRHEILTDGLGPQPQSQSQSNQEQDKIVAAKLVVYAGEEDSYFSFITPEAYQAVKEWMNYRAKTGEKITGDSPVIRDYACIKYGQRTTKLPRRLGVESIGRIVEIALKEEGIREPLQDGAKRYQFQANHGFRKWFKTAAELAGMPAMIVEILMSHTLGISDHYGRPSEEQLFRAYLKVVPNLTINKQLIMKEEIDALKQHQDHKVAELQQQLKSWEEIAEKMKVYVDRQKKKEESLEATVKRYLDEHSWYVNKYGFSDSYRKKIKEFGDKLEALPEDNDNYYDD